MFQKLKALSLLVAVVFMGACAGPAINHYQGSEPELDPKEFFNGPIKAWGIVQDWQGKVVRRFDADLIGTWDGDTGRLDEVFDYYDGESQERVWIITRREDGTYTGTAGDIVGEADGEVAGSAMRWAYQMDLEVNGSTHRVTFDDWMFLMNDDVLINRSYIKKYGFTVAEVILFMQKQDEIGPDFRTLEDFRAEQKR